MKYVFIILFVLISSVLFSQKHDYVWLFGYSSSETDSTFGGTVLDFNDDLFPDIYYQYREMNFLTTATSISDSLGNLLFYTNGLDVADATHQIMENGGNINPGRYADDHPRGYVLAQGALILPMPENDSLYYLIHEAKDYPTENLRFHSPICYYSLINMNLGNNRGALTEKNIPIIQDTLDLGKITATRHANGRDWWVILPEYATNRYHRLLLTPNGIEQYNIQEVGNHIPLGIGQSAFSPDGTKYVRYNLFGGIETPDLLSIYDFDRCEGILSNPRHIINFDSATAGGVAISSNSRYLYLSSFTKVYQFDLEAEDIEGSKDTIAVYDGFRVDSLFATTFYLAQLAPNGKIYINSNNGVNYLHVINEPDKKGLACDLVQHGVELPTFNAFSMPNFPNYRLGALADSPCDTLRNPTNTIELETAFQINTYPNPVRSQLTVDLTLPSYEKLDNYYLELHNLYGQMIERRQLREFAPIYRFSVGDLPRGVYVVNLYWKGEVVAVKKVVVQ